MPQNFMETTRDTTASGNCGCCGAFLVAAHHVVITHEPTLIGAKITGIEPLCNDCAREHTLDNELNTQQLEAVVAAEPSDEFKVFSYVASTLEDALGDREDSYHNLSGSDINEIIQYLGITTLNGVDDQELVENIMTAADVMLARRRNDEAS